MADDPKPISLAEAKKRRASGAGGAGGAPGDDWTGDLIKNGRGEILPLLANAITAFRNAPEWRGVFGFDEFHQATAMCGMPPWDGERDLGRKWTSVDDLRAAEWAQHQRIHISPDIVGQAVEVVARDRSFHPVLEYLDRLEHDGEPRLDMLFPRYFGADDTPYSRAVGARFLIGGVARVSEPGCKADCCPIIEGKQGLLKSTALKTIGHPWYAEEIAAPGSKDSALQLAGVWILELAEFEHLSARDAGQVKAWMSRGTDRFRPPYAKRVIDQPRQCVFAGTVNKSTYLSDETGARRFWPITCTSVDLDMLSVDRDQLWAEARARYRAGDAWWLESGSLQAQAADEQSARYQEDAWEGLIADAVVSAVKRATAKGEPAAVTVAEMLRDVIGLNPERWEQKHQNRVARCLVHLRWKRVQIRKGGKRHWIYVPGDAPSPVSPDDKG